MSYNPFDLRKAARDAAESAENTAKAEGNSLMSHNQNVLMWLGVGTIVIIVVALLFLAFRH